MKTKNIFKALALAMLMPTMLLTTACSSDDDAIINENNNQKGYALPITVNVTRQGDATTRATYNETTKELSFSTGDKLFVSFYDSNNSVGYVAGTLTWQSGGSFSGTLYTEHEYPGTALELIKDKSDNMTVYLLPNGYEGYNYFKFSDLNTYYATPGFSSENAFAGSKATAVEQFSKESASSYSNGFALSPKNAIISFTITGFTDGETVTASLETGLMPISGTVKAGANGIATFAMGIDLAAAQPLTNYTLTVNGTKFGLGERTFTAGHIYTVNRSMAAEAAAVTVAPTATEGTIKSGSTTPLVTAGTATGGTMMYAVTETNTKPTSTAEFSATVPTAEGKTPGTYYVWYYAQADKSHKDSEIAATAVTQTIAPPTLAEALVSGATVTVNFKYNGGDNSCTFTNSGDGTFAFNGGTGTLGNDITCAKALIIDDDNIIFKQNYFTSIDTRWDEYGFQVTFNTTDNTYNVWKGSSTDAQNASFTSISVNGTNITSQLTVKVAASKALTAVTGSEKGWRIGSDGNAYEATGTLPTGVTAVAKIIYVGSNTDTNNTYTHGLALALKDESGMMNWSTANSTCSNKNTSVHINNASWMLPSQDQWFEMWSAGGGTQEALIALRDGFSSVGGTNLLSDEYWSSNTWEDDGVGLAYVLSFKDGTGSGAPLSSSRYVRACLAF